MTEIQTNSGTFILPISKYDLIERMIRVSTEDKQHLLEAATEYNKLNHSDCEKLFLMNKAVLTRKIRNKNPDFDPERDFIFISYGESNTVHQ